VNSTPARPQQTTKWAWITGTFFGIGLVGKGGGTVASIATLLLWLLFASHHAAYALSLTMAAAILVTLIGIPASTIVARECGKKDPSEVVIDEVAGQLIPLIICPADWKYALASLILFRALDIFKPPPISTLEKLEGGLGIMMDDVAAGLIAMLVIGAMRYFHVFQI
jgi:phosphatidylglycerophosphatase A